MDTYSPQFKISLSLSNAKQLTMLKDSKSAILCFCRNTLSSISWQAADGYRKLIALLLLLSSIGISGNLNAGFKNQTLSINDIVSALIEVESGGNIHAVGDNGKALGILQIHAVMVEDYNRIYKTSFVHKDAYDPVIAKKICAGILNHYGNYIRAETGKAPNAKQLAFVWNGGGNAWRRVENPKADKVQENLEQYWRRVSRALNCWP